MTQLLLYHARFLSPSAPHFLLRPFSSRFRSQSLLFIFFQCVLSACAPTISHFLFMFISVSSVFYVFPPSEVHNAAPVSLNIFCLCSLYLFIYCGPQSTSPPPPPPILSHPHSAFHFIPSHLSPSIPLQLWQRTISPPVLSCVPRLPWTRAAVWRE